MSESFRNYVFDDDGIFGQLLKRCPDGVCFSIIVTHDGKSWVRNSTLEKTPDPPTTSREYFNGERGKRIAPPIQEPADAVSLESTEVVPVWLVTEPASTGRRK